jgi:hypothetical protein
MTTKTRHGSDDDTVGGTLTMSQVMATRTVTMMTTTTMTSMSFLSRVRCDDVG